MALHQDNQPRGTPPLFPELAGNPKAHIAALRSKEKTAGQEWTEFKSNFRACDLLGKLTVIFACTIVFFCLAAIGAILGAVLQFPAALIVGISFLIRAMVT
ncbi:hypothetical protein IZ6_07350 [Terrihabitans soli]|uniref:Uncharacterized protein n=1 Tax=Terrihabitans soli TaxID=708113 RepID=A0A6S6QSU2_9HYPH|nr:hypothetical protein [Terrihabitans soli]BCJ90000.1 hypothetical protein IZ6_07350 [Terrihabitans soli]